MLWYLPHFILLKGRNRKWLTIKEIVQKAASREEAADAEAKKVCVFCGKRETISKAYFPAICGQTDNTASAASAVAVSTAFCFFPTL